MKSNQQAPLWGRAPLLWYFMFPLQHGQISTKNAEVASEKSRSATERGIFQGFQQSLVSIVFSAYKKHCFRADDFSRD
jgi:hypothetical protein